MGAKWTWVVRFVSGRAIDVPVAKGRRDAVLQAYWMVKDLTGTWEGRVDEVQKRPTSANGLKYLSYRAKA